MTCLLIKKKLDEKKWYFDVRRECDAGALTFNLYLPAFDKDDLADGQVTQYTFYVGSNERARI